jgi:integrase
VTAAQRRTIKQRIDIEIPGFGRFCKRTGAKTMPEHRARRALLQRLIEADQLDVIGMLDRGEVTWTELRQAERKKRLHSDALAADVALSRPLWNVGEAKGAFAVTLPRMGKAQASRDRYEVAFGQLNTYAADFLPANAIVKDLKTVPWPDVWAALSELSAASRNRVRSSLSAFMTVFLGDKYHPFRRDVMKALGGMEDETTEPRQVTLEEFWKVFDALDDAVKPTALTLAGSGMRVGEYLQCTEHSVRRLPIIWIPDGKTGGAETSVAESLVPFVELAIPCRLAPAPAVWRGVQYDARYKRIYKAFAAASIETGIPCSPHYLRHLYAQLATAELPDVLVQQGLRHKTPSMTRHYSKRRITKQVADVVGKALERKKTKAKKVRVKVRAGSQRKAV